MCQSKGTFRIGRGGIHFGVLSNHVSASIYFPVPIKLTSEMLKQLDLSQRSLSEDLLAEYIGNLCDWSAHASYPGVQHI